MSLEETKEDNMSLEETKEDKRTKVGVEDFKGPELVKTIKACVAELMGTMFLVLIGCGAAHSMGDDVVHVALAFGLTVATMAQSIGHVSGCHINPAVTSGLLVAGKISLLKAILFVVSQCVGGIIGALFLKGLIGVSQPLNVGEGEIGFPGMTLLTSNSTTYGTINAGQGFGIEFFMTFVLVTVIFGSAADDVAAKASKGSAPLAIGLAISTCILFAGPLTGGSLNPARSLGPAIIGGNMANHWVYWLGPILGGVCASIMYNLLFKAESEEEKKKVSEEEKKKVSEDHLMEEPKKAEV